MHSQWQYNRNLTSRIWGQTFLNFILRATYFIARASQPIIAEAIYPVTRTMKHLHPLLKLILGTLFPYIFLILCNHSLYVCFHCSWMPVTQSVRTFFQFVPIFQQYSSRTLQKPNKENNGYMLIIHIYFIKH